MKKTTLTISAVLCAALCASVHADLAGTSKTITLDGNLADWNASDILYSTDEIGDGAPDASRYEKIYLANDASNLYVGLDMAGVGGGNVKNSWTRNIYIDTDRDAGTGFNAGWMANGYDILIQYGAGGGSYSVHKFTAATQADWGWKSVGKIKYSYSDDIAELSVSLSLLGLSSGDAVVVEFNASGAGVTTETWAHVSEANAETYTLATPKPVAPNANEPAEQ